MWSTKASLTAERVFPVTMTNICFTMTYRKPTVTFSPMSRSFTTSSVDVKEDCIVTTTVTRYVPYGYNLPKPLDAFETHANILDLAPKSPPSKKKLVFREQQPLVQEAEPSSLKKFKQSPGLYVDDTLHLLASPKENQGSEESRDFFASLSPVKNENFDITAVKPLLSSPPKIKRILEFLL